MNEIATNETTFIALRGGDSGRVYCIRRLGFRRRTARKDEEPTVTAYLPGTVNNSVLIGKEWRSAAAFCRSSAFEATDLRENESQALISGVAETEFFVTA